MKLETALSRPGASLGFLAEPLELLSPSTPALASFPLRPVSRHGPFLAPLRPAEWPALKWIATAGAVTGFAIAWTLLFYT